MTMPSERIVMTCGGFDPVHIGHVRLFNEAKKLGDKLFVVLNGDGWIKRKKGKVFMPVEERAEIILALKAVDYVAIWDDGKDHIGEAIKTYKPAVLAKGGDRNSLADIPKEEIEACVLNGTKIVFGVGGGKIQSSSWLIHGKPKNKTE